MLLQAGGVTRTIGRVKAGTALLDAAPWERKRGMSLQPSFAWFAWGERLLNLIDTPGSEAAAFPRRLSAMAGDTAVVVVDSAEGLELGSEQAIGDACALGAARFVVLSKVDRADQTAEIEIALAAIPGVVVIPITVLVKEGGRPKGVISLLDWRHHPNGSEDEGAPLSGELVESNAELLAAWERLTEAVAVTDDALLVRYLDGAEISRAEVLVGLANAVRVGRLCPLLHCSSELFLGARPLLDALAALAPSPADHPIPAWEADGTQIMLDPNGPFVAQWLATQLDDEREPFHILRVWSGTPPRSACWVNGGSGETARVRKLYQIRGPRRASAFYLGAGSIIATWDPLCGVPGDSFTEQACWVLRAPEVPPHMVAAWVGPATATGQPAAPKSNEERRFDDVVARLAAMDPSVTVASEKIRGGRVIHADSELQLAWFVERAWEWFDVALLRAPPPVPYRELPAAMVTKVPGVHRKEDNHGNVLEFAEVHLDLWALEGSEEITAGVHVECWLDPDEVPLKFHEAIVEGVYRGLGVGPRGFPVSGAVARVVGGEYDILESTAEHFLIAGQLAAKAALELATTRLLEPWVEVVIWSAPDVSGMVLAEVASRGGRILGLEVAGEHAALYAQVPYRQLRTFASVLMSLTSGRGRFHPGEWHWELLPAHLVSSI